MKRVRTKEHYQKSNATRKKKVAAWRAAAVNSGKRDSKRVSTLSLEQLQFLYEDAVDHYRANEDDCHISKGQKMSSGYPRGLSLETFSDFSEYDNNEFHKSLLFQRSAIVLAANGFMATDSKDDASHLCNNRMCVNVKHLCWESRIANLSRVNCPIQLMCEHCDKLTNACTHNPKCIKQK